MLLILTVSGWKTFSHSTLWELRYLGYRVERAEQLLMDAAARFKQEADANRGSVTEHSRCYFVTAPGDTGAVPIPVTNHVACGPVQFVNGTVKVPYLEFALLASKPSHGHVTLSIDRAQAPIPISAPPPGQRLVRPDRLTPPDGSGDLARPGAPPAIGDVLARAATVSPAVPAANVSLIGRSTGVQLLAYGTVAQYGVGADARSAPSGRRLIAFKVAARPGEDGTSGLPSLFVRVDGKRRGPLVLTDQYVVTAVPVTSQNVDLVLDDPGGEQSLSLLTGKPAATNPTVIRRTHRSVGLSVERAVNVKVSGKKGSGITSGKVSFTSVSLLYWAPDGSHAAGPGRALLQIVATMRLAGDKTDYGVEPGLLSASGSGDTPARARNAAARGSNSIVAVVDVPADITAGTITFQGTTTIAGKGTITVQNPLTLDFTIPAN